MDQKRKQVLILEINRWKQNNLLPGHYCDFLLALYTEGRHQVHKNSHKSLKLPDSEFQQIIIMEIAKWKENHLLPANYCDYLLSIYIFPKKNLKKQRNFKVKKDYLYFLILVPVLLSFTYFTEIAPTMQIGLLLFFIFLGLTVAYRLFKKGGWFQVPLAISAFITLIFSVSWIKGLYPDNLQALYYTVLGNTGIWIIFGLLFRLITFIVSGVLGALLVLYFMNT